MSVLAWLFGLGAAAVVFPVLFHLIRRTPKGETEFSSLMFLKSSPPTLTRRSRLDNLWLLLLRALAICLLAVAFMRPFFRGNAELAQLDVEHRRVAILLDVSASMRRANVWEDAKKRVSSTLDQLEVQDQVALYVFDRDVRAIVEFDEEEEATRNNRETIAAIKEKLADIDPSWKHSDLGGAMVAVASQMDGWQDASRGAATGTRPKLQMFVVSDMQSGSSTEALQAYQWPQLVKVKFESVAPLQSDNATVELLSQVAEEKQPSIRVRVTNQSDADSEAFTVNWETRERPELNQARTNIKQAADENANGLSFVVAAGESRVLTKPLEEIVAANTFVLSGDGEDFDNSYFISPAAPQTLSMLYIGDDDPDDPQTALFYLARAFSRTPTRSFVLVRLKAEGLSLVTSVRDFAQVAEVISVNGERVGEEASATVEAANRSWLASGQPTMLILGSGLDGEGSQLLDKIVREGASLFALASTGDVVDSAGELLGVQEVLGRGAESPPKRSGKSNYAMLADVEYKDPVFQPFADPKFSDFTGVKFWQHQRLKLEEDCEMLATFDDRTPAVWRRPLGQGEVVAFSSSWQPADSQFALSSKFVAFISNLLELAADVPLVEAAKLVGDPLVFDPSAQPRVVIKPNGCVCDVLASQASYRGTTQPGIYRLTSEAKGVSKRDAAEQVFAVNVDRRESQTELLAVDQLERLGVQVGLQTTAASEIAQLRELQDRELESQQQVWKWLIVAAIAVLIFESFYAGWKTTRSEIPLPASSDSSPAPV